MLVGGDVVCDTNWSIIAANIEINERSFDNMVDANEDFATSCVSGPTENADERLPRVRRRSQWEGPNEEFLQLLMDLGISKNAAEKVATFHF
ncbi:hypothetical protein P5673_017074 [Acropora cervicornis]|uniref:Uncharacterized protein n=1 Tax=Acropora cervicornis TaxID=6130 RepID=A0AAD9QFV1_ACRCE|nr:hypothetical protein P5673_017074 [Acropora cervicornis]